MKSTKILLALPLISLCLSACGQKNYSTSDYELTMNWKNNFKILQLTDIHLGVKDDLERQFQFMDLTYEEALNNGGLDLVVVTGDLFTFADRTVAKKLFRWMDSHEIPWTVTWGNHDEQCYFSIDWVTGYLNKLSKSSSSYCIFKDLQNDDVYGNANFYINLKNGNENKFRIFIMDSNRYNFSDGFNYDFIKQSQIDWYKNVYEAETTKVPSLIYQHIPLPEYNQALLAARNGINGSKFLVYDNDKTEDVCAPEFNSGFFNAITEIGATLGVYCGHDHVSSWTAEYHYDLENPDKIIHLGYGVNSTDRIYYDAEMMGGQVITITENVGQFELSYYQIDHTYSEIGGNN